ncbi:MAG: lysophospholipid acyltransferase family protein [Elusimicrobiota bacterium]|nr:lysophospholipid acyltransferase family protein [Elusimicrobiota bacterium]
MCPAAALGKAYLYFVAMTSSVKEDNAPGFEKLRESGKPFIYAFWHGRQLFLIYTHRFRGINIIISESKDGSYVAALVEKLGNVPVRGSTSRGGMKALVEMIKKLRSGAKCAFTPDGPKGPLRKVHPGVVYAARKTGCPVVPVSFSARRVMVLGRWDEFIVPYPFNKIAVCQGEPLYFDESGDIEVQEKELQKVLNGITEHTDNLTGFKIGKRARPLAAG